MRWHWFIARDTRLSAAATAILLQAETGEAQAIISTLVLAELTYIAQRQRVPIAISEIIAKINQADGFSIVPFDLAVFQVMLTLPESWDIHDRIIAATANYYDAPLITRDGVLKASDQVSTLWD